MTSAAIVDTNVVVAGLLTTYETSPVARILDGMFAASFQFVISEPLLDEYRVVLERPTLRRLHGLTTVETESLVVSLAEHAIVLDPVPTVPAPDPGDQHLWELLAARTDLCLVTGDKPLLQAETKELRILSPDAFAAGLP